MMSYIMPCTSLCSSGGTLMRRTSPCTRIIGGRPDGQVQVGRLVLDREGEQFGDIHYNPPVERRSDFSSLVQRIMATIADNLQVVRARIAARSRSDCACDVVGSFQGATGSSASRTRSPPGQRAFGENYVQEAVQKMQALARRSEWHLIGPLQSNKTRLAAERFDWVQTVAS